MDESPWHSSNQSKLQKPQAEGLRKPRTY